MRGIPYTVAAQQKRIASEGSLHYLVQCIRCLFIFVFASNHGGGSDEAGRLVSSGVYFYRLEIEGAFLDTKKMVLVR